MLHILEKYVTYLEICYIFWKCAIYFGGGRKCASVRKNDVRVRLTREAYGAPKRGLGELDGMGGSLVRDNYIRAVKLPPR